MVHLQCLFTQLETGVNGFTLDPLVGLYLLSHPQIKIPKSGNIYSVNEGNYYNWDENLQNEINNFKKQSMKARYIGSMVADVHRTLIKGGSFFYPADINNPNGKLRLLYEASPMAYLFEQAGGIANNGEQSLLDIIPNDLHQRVPVFLKGK